MAVCSIVALMLWNSAYRAEPDKPLRMHVIQSDSVQSPNEALTRLAAVQPAYEYETRLSEAPVWLLVKRTPDRNPSAVEFPSRHAVDMVCWDVATLQVLGKASKTRSEGELAPAKSGFVLQSQAPQVLCRASFVGPARLTALQWSPSQLAISEAHFHRKSGLLDGGLVVLAMFVLMIALINREKLYILFGVWLCLNLRVGALSAGWDVQWLGQRVPEDWLLPMRTITIALYALVTLELYITLFREQIPRTRFAVPLTVTHWMCVPLLVAAVVMPFKAFLPVMWVLVGTGLLVMVLSLLGILSRTRSKVAFWLVAAFGVMFVSSLSEVIAAALGLRDLVGMINSVTAALASSLLAALAIAERMRQEHNQRIEAQRELEHTYEVMPVGLFTLDAQGSLLGANPALSQILGRTGRQLMQKRWMAHFAPGTWTMLHEEVHRQSQPEMEVWNADRTRRYLLRATLSQGKIEGFLQDITEQAKANEDLRFMANNDPLTKVFNRRGIEHVFTRAAEEGKPMALAYLDLDRFKLINDLFGHSAGDEVLKQVCERVNSILARGHQIGRVGGDEFVIVMPDTAVPLASLICEGIVTGIGKSPYRVGDKAFHVRGSIGLVEVSAGMSMKDAISAADRACREAKARQGEGLVVYERNARAFDERQAELGMVEQLSGADATRNLYLEMQPIMSLNNPRASLNFEVLLRMRGPEGKVISAGPIISAAEKGGLTSMIDRWVLSTTLQWIEENLPALSKTQFVCMNLSGASLNDEHFIQDTLVALEEYPVGARFLCMEVTESVALHDLDNTRRFIDQIRSCGVRVALDDFGAGYTSFSYLKELPADVLKIDGQFVLNINAHPANVAIVEAIVKLAMNLGMKTIAEWAEDAATAKTLAEIGVDYVQGFVVSRSQPAHRIVEAESAASFIVDAEMLELVRKLEEVRQERRGDYNNVLNFRDIY
ncbi:diguanylate cyclase [Noviherbaspirillum denitrificans]|uniref:Diguanylate cyclase n=1 Tax=Noviherbaspirillum denitrificans TaxID=1968433 RepID=A0A254TT18_9BURK|nr:diguanylate cyclase [Noviherbaspirillum denitrificans]